MAVDLTNLRELKTSIPKDKFLIMQCGHVRIAITSDPISLPKQVVERHDHFEFFIPLSHMSAAYIEKKRIDCQPGNIVAINPGQSHGMQRNTRNSTFISLFFGKNYMEKIITEVAGEIQYFPNYVQHLRPEVQRLVLQIIEEYRESRVCKHQYMTALSELLAYTIVRYHHLPAVSPVQDIQFALNSQQRRFMDVINFMNENIEEKITVEQLAQKALMNRFHFIRSFKNAFGSSPYDYLTGLRMARAKQLLSSTNLSASEIGRSCGYFSASRFSAAFKMITGKTPSVYRQVIVAERKHLKASEAFEIKHTEKSHEEAEGWEKLTAVCESPTPSSDTVNI